MRLALFAVVLGVCSVAFSKPIPVGKLRKTVVMVAGGSAYNPRSADGKNHIVGLQSRLSVFGRGGSTPDVAVSYSTDQRMTTRAGFGGTDYVLASGGSYNNSFALLNYSTLSVVALATSSYGAVEPATFDWVDNGTIIFSSYENRGVLYMADVAYSNGALTVAESGIGAVTTSAARIRSVFVGDVYNGYAYYSSSSASSVGVYALDLTTGVESLVMTYTEGQYRYNHGVWTVKELDGYLYIHTPGDGVTVYNMTDATTVGSVAETYSQSLLDSLTGNTNASYGFDVVENGNRMLYSNGTQVVEFVYDKPPVAVWGSGAVVVLLLRRRRK